MTDKTDALEALVENVIRESIESHCPRGKWITGPNTLAISIKSGVLQALAAPAEGGQGEVAEYQFRCPKAADNTWRRMSKQEYDATVLTGHACGNKAWTRDVELRKLYTTPPAASVDASAIMEVVERYAGKTANATKYIRQDLLKLIDSAGEAKGGVDVACTDMGNYTDYAFPQPAEGDGAVEWQYRFNSVESGWSPWTYTTEAHFDEINRAIALGACSQTRALYTRPAATAVVPEGWRVLNFTGSFKTRGERWEVYDPDGNGGAICDGDVADPVLRNLLDALAAAPAAPKGGVDDARRLDFIAGIWSKGLTPQLAAVIEAFRAGDSETIRATIDAALATGEQP